MAPNGLAAVCWALAAVALPGAEGLRPEVFTERSIWAGTGTGLEEPVGSEHASFNLGHSSRFSDLVHRRSSSSVTGAGEALAAVAAELAPQQHGHRAELATRQHRRRAHGSGGASSPRRRVNSAAPAPARIPAAAAPAAGQRQSSGISAIGAPRPSPQQTTASRSSVGTSVKPSASQQSWLERFGGSLWSVLIGLFLVIPFSTSLLWVNEKQCAELECCLSDGQREATTLDLDKVDVADYDGTLVHLSSAHATGVAPVQDERFPEVRIDRGCLQLKSRVEVLQWEESENYEDDESAGGVTGEEFTYQKAWGSKVIDSTAFPLSHKNVLHIPELQVGERIAISGLVKYGEPFQIPEVLVKELGNWEDASTRLGKEVVFGSCTFRKGKGPGNWYYCPPNLGEDPDAGAMRVMFDCVQDCPASILALQMEGKEGCRTFGPYRAVSRGIFGCCLRRAGDAKVRRLAAAAQTHEQITKEARCCDLGPFSCLCGCCNLASFFLSHLQTTEIYGAWPGWHSKEECFDNEIHWASAQRWGCRLLGWLFLWLGFMMLFEPLTVILDVIPFLGPYLSTGFSFVVTIFCFVITFVVASLLVACAYLTYNPTIGLMFLALTGLVVSLLAAAESGYLTA